MDLVTVSANDTSYNKLLKRELKEFVMPKLKSNDKIYLLMHNNNYVSMVYFTQYLDSFYINYIHTNPKYRRQGHSLYLVQKVMIAARASNCKSIQVTILPDSGSDYVFLKLGFKYTSDNTSMTFNLSV